MGTELSENTIKTLRHDVYKASRDGQGIHVFDILLAANQETVFQEVLSYYTEDGEQITTPLIIAARNGNIKVLNVLLSAFCVDIEQTGTVKFDNQNIRGATALWCAADAGYLEIVRLLVEHGANVNHQTTSGSTPIRAACYAGFLDIVKYLVAKKADIHIANKGNSNCLMIACYKGHRHIVKYLLEIGADFHKKDDLGSTALHYSAEAGHLMIIKMLIKRGMTITIKDENRITPLMVAAMHGKEEAVEYLTTLPECTKEDKIDAFKLLATSFTECEDYDTNKVYKYLEKAIKERHVVTSMVQRAHLTSVPVCDNRVECQTVKQLEQLKNDYLAIQMEALTIRERIFGPESPIVANTMLNAGAFLTVNGEYDKGIDLLLNAIKLSQKIDEGFYVEQCSDMFDRLIQLGINFKFETILEVFSYAINELKEDMKRLENPDGDPGSLWQIFQDTIVACMCFISIMLRMNKTETDTFELHRAVHKFVQQKTRLANGFTPLHICCDIDTRIDDVEFYNVTFPDAVLCKTLVACGADVNAQDNRKNTPLHIIAKCREGTSINAVADIIASLTEHGAHVDICNQGGETAVDVATTDSVEFIIKTQLKISLKCLAAKAVKRYRIIYKDVIPVNLQNFVELH